MTTTIRLSGPADMLAVLPYQLGFHPRDCLMAVSMHGNRMGLVQRIDLPPPAHVADAVGAMIGPLRQDKPEAVFIIGFEEREGDSRAMLDELARVCGAHDIPVSDRLVVRDGRWFAPDCHRDCCPDEGLALPNPSEVPAVAEFVGREICPLPDRSALAARLELSRPFRGREVSQWAEKWWEVRIEAPDPEGGEQDWDDEAADTHDCALDDCGLDDCGLEDCGLEVGGPGELRGCPGLERGRSLAGDLAEARAMEFESWSLVLNGGDDAKAIRDLGPADLAFVAVSLTDVDLRDALIAWLCPGTLPTDLIPPELWRQMSRELPERLWLDPSTGDVDQSILLQRIERRLCELVAELPDEWAVGALTVLASFTWWRGDGALTRIALDRALRVDPNYRLARLLEQMVDLAIRPDKASA